MNPAGSKNSLSVGTKIAASSGPFVIITLGLYLLQNSWLTVMLYHLYMLGWVLLSGRADLFRLVAKGWNVRAFSMLAGLGIVAGVAIIALWPVFRRDGVEMAEVLQRLDVAYPLRLIFSGYSVAVNPLMEEVFWRGLINGRSKRPNWADTAFGGYHIPVLLLGIGILPTLLAFAGLTLAGWAFRMAYLKFEGLASSYAGHLVANICISAAITWTAHPFS